MIAKQTQVVTTSDKKYDLFIKSCVATLRKYNIDHLAIAVSMAANNDFASFTNDSENGNRYREEMKAKLTKEDVIKYRERVIYESGWAMMMGTDPSHMFADIINSNYNQSMKL